MIIIIVSIIIIQKNILNLKNKYKNMKMKYEIVLELFLHFNYKSN